MPLEGQLRKVNQMCWEDNPAGNLKKDQSYVLLYGTKAVRLRALNFKLYTNKVRMLALHILHHMTPYIAVIYITASSHCMVLLSVAIARDVIRLTLTRGGNTLASMNVTYGIG